MAPSGQEVMRFYMAGENAKGIRKMEAALARAQSEWERNILRNLLAQLKGRVPVEAPAKDKRKQAWSPS